jgi:hypothetical protein
LNRMITDLAAFSGMEMENMTRGHGWRFLDVGRRLERAMNATSLVAGAVGRPLGQRGAGAAARDRRQLDDLPPSLFRAAAALARPGPAAPRRHQYSRRGVSAGGRVGARSAPAARSPGAVADARGTA